MKPCLIIEPWSATNFDAETTAATTSWDSSGAFHLAALKALSNIFLAALVATLKDLNTCAEPESAIIN